jgi:hypothetical protein
MPKQNLHKYDNPAGKKKDYDKNNTTKGRDSHVTRNRTSWFLFGTVRNGYHVGHLARIYKKWTSKYQRWHSRSFGERPHESCGANDWTILLPLMKRSSKETDVQLKYPVCVISLLVSFPYRWQFGTVQMFKNRYEPALCTADSFISACKLRASQIWQVSILARVLGLSGNTLSL